MSSLFTVRPSGSDRTPFRINLTAVSLLSLKLRSGDLCTLCLPGEATSHRTAIAWENSTSGMKDGVVQTSKLLQELYGLKLGDRVTVQRVPEQLQDSDHVVLRPNVPLSETEVRDYCGFASATIPQRHDVLAPTQKLMIEVGLMKERFEVVSVGGLLGRITTTTTFSIERAGSPDRLEAPPLDFSSIGGLDTQLEEIKSFVEAFTDVQRTQIWSNYRPNRGLLIYGAKGTGKTLMLNALANSGWPRVKRWTPGFKVAPSQTLQLITIEFSDLIMSDYNIQEVASLFSTLQKTPSLVVASVRHPNDIPERLRSANQFGIEVELPIPDSDQRLDILKVLRGAILEPSDEMLTNLAGRTHGFVGADLDKLLQKIWDVAFRRRKQQSSKDTTENQIASHENAFILAADIESALQQIRPSALQEIFLEKPNVYWSDIGGQHDIKERLQDAIELPLKYPDRMRKLGLVPAKGVLLYGPPGCSKTLTVKALATEADYNFLAVKGAELISMYVGESERATREVFRKARQASPSIIFFDEIDAIASRGKSGSDLHVLTTLLNEMDGFEELRNVMVVAATNKPESIDPALMRPGRFDSVVYVGPPDLDTRKDIFDKKFAPISVTDEVQKRTMEFAQRTDGFSGAEIVAVCQKAGWKALKSGEDAITAEHILDAISETTKGITPQMLKSYDDWNSQRTR